MKKNKIGIRAQVTFFVVVLILVVTLASSVLVLKLQKDSLTAEVSLRGLSIAKNLAGNISDFLLTEDELSIARILSETMSNKGVLYAMVVGKKGRILAHSNMERIGDKYSEPESVNVENEDIKGASIYSEGGKKILDFSVDVIAKGRLKLGTAHVGVSYTLIENVIKSATVKLVVISVLALLLGIFGAFILAVTVTKPVKVLAEGATILGTGNLDHKITVKANNELGDLADIFNKMTVDLKSAHEASIKQQVFQKELEVAKEIQLSLIPKEIADIKGYEVAKYYEAAKEVGGDYYDVIDLSDGKFGFIVADVSGKGIPAAFIMTMARSILHSESLDSRDMASCETLKRLNKIIFPDIKEGMFITAYYGLLDTAKSTIDISSAGHNDTIIYRAKSGDLETYNPKGFGIGMDPGQRFEKIVKNEVVVLEKGDQVIAFTDGISEAMNKNNDEYGDKRLMDVIKANGVKSAQELMDAVIKDVESFVDGYEQSDDIAIVVLKKQ